MIHIVHTLIITRVVHANYIVGFSMASRKKVLLRLSTYGFIIIFIMLMKRMTKSDYARV